MMGTEMALETSVSLNQLRRLIAREYFITDLAIHTGATSFGSWQGYPLSCSLDFPQSLQYCDSEAGFFQILNY
jgi:hypothetical protein